MASAKQSTTGPRGVGELLESLDRADRCPIKAGPQNLKMVPAVGRHQVEAEPVDTGFGWDWFDQLPGIKAATATPDQGVCRIGPIPKTPKSKKRKSRSSKKKGGDSKILAAAEAAFTTRGYHGGRMSSIAAAAGCNKALIHYYFKDKLSLYRRILVDIVRTIAAQLEKALSQDNSGLEPIENLVEACLDLDTELAGRLTILQREVLEGGRELALALEESDDVYARLARQLKPLLGPDWRPESLIRTLAGLLTAARLIEPRSKSTLDREHLKTTIKCLLGKPA